MERKSHNAFQKDIKNGVKHIWASLKKTFNTITRYLWFSWWIIVWLVFVIFFLVIHYQNKLAHIQVPRWFVYYERPQRIYRDARVFDIFNTQHQRFDDLFRQQEKVMNSYENFIDSHVQTVDSVKKNQQTYQKYYLYDGNVYSYTIDYDDWIVYGSITIDNDNQKKDVLIQKIQKLWINVSDSGMHIMLSWKIDHINSLLDILD